MLTTDENGVPVSEELRKPIKVRFHRACGPKGWREGDPTFKKGDIVEMPLHMARTYVGLSQASYTDDGPVTFDFVAAMKAAEEKRKAPPAKKAPPKKALAK